MREYGMAFDTLPDSLSFIEKRVKLAPKNKFELWFDERKGMWIVVQVVKRGDGATAK